MVLGTRSTQRMNEKNECATNTYRWRYSSATFEVATVSTRNVENVLEKTRRPDVDVYGWMLLLRNWNESYCRVPQAL